MTGKTYQTSLKEQELVLTEALQRKDPEIDRIKRYLAMPDLSRTPGSPLHEIAERVKNVPTLKEFDEIIIPEIVPTDISFDLFNFPENHPARSRSDTYYVNDTNILRTHGTVMWYYYLNLPEIKERLNKKEPFGVLCHGKVYRKDEIDRKHMNIFHQMDGLYMVPDSQNSLSLDDLKNVLTEVVQAIFGKEIEFRFNVDTFPYTDPSLEVEVKINGDWVEILGSGMPKKAVMANFGLEGYNGWAFGFGLERLALIGMELPDIRLLWSTDERVKKQLKLGQKFVEVSKYPPVLRDISFIVDDDFAPNNYFDLVRDVAGDLVEEMTLLDKYESKEKFGEGKVSYAYRIIYRSLDRTLTNAEIDKLHKELEEATVKTYNATIR